MFRFSMDTKDASNRSAKELLKSNIVADPEFTQKLWENLKQKYPQYDFYPGARIKDKTASLEFRTLEYEEHFRCDATPNNYEEASNIVSEAFFFGPERVWLEDSLITTPDPNDDSNNYDDDNDDFDDDDDFLGGEIVINRTPSSSTFKSLSSLSLSQTSRKPPVAPEEPKKNLIRPGYCKCGSGKKYKKCCGK